MKFNDARKIAEWEGAGFLGMSVEMLEWVYGHHHPDHLRRAAHSLGYRPTHSLAVPLAVSPKALLPKPQPTYYLKTLVADAFVVEPVSTARFPANREKIRDIFNSEAFFRFVAFLNPMISAT
jgi:hypothetical protein